MPAIEFRIKRILKISEATGLGRVFRIERTLTGAIESVLGPEAVLA